MGDGWSEVSLSAYASDLSSEDIEDLLPGSVASQGDPHLASVRFKPQPGSRLDDVLADIAQYLHAHGEELRSGLGRADFQVRIGWSRQTPAEPVPASSSLRAALAKLQAEGAVDVHVEMDQDGEPPLTQRSGSGDKPAADGIDEDAWQCLTLAVVAANRADLNGMAMHLHGFKSLADDQAHDAGRYLWYLLRYRVVQLLRRRPTAEDLHELASRTYPRYRQVVRESVITLEDTLRFFFRLPPVGSQLPGGRLFASATTILGVLLDDPSADLVAIRPALAKWRSRDVGTAGQE